MKNHQVVITFNPNTNQIQVQGPMDNGVLFLGLLEMAKAVYFEQRRKQGSQNVVVPQLVPPHKM